MQRQGIVDLGRALVDEVTQLVRLEIQLAKEEIREMVVTDVKAAVFLIVAGLLALIGLILGLVALAFLLGNFILSAGWWVFIFFLLLIIGAVVLGMIGKNRLRIGPPEQTLATLREDVEWAKLQIKRDGR